MLMVCIRYCLVAILLLGSVLLLAQASSWEHFSYGEEVLSMAQSVNNLIIGTKTGLVRYDIVSHQKEVLNKTNSPLPSNWVAGVAISPTGLIALGTPEGLCIIEGDSWQIYDASNSPIPSNSIYKTMISPNGTVWALSKNNEDYDYLYSYSDGVWSVLSQASTNIPGSQIRDFTLDPSGAPAIIYYNLSSNVNGLAVWDGTYWVNYTDQSMGVSSNMLSLLVYFGDKYWLTDGYSIYSWDGSQLEVFDPSLPMVQAHHIISLNVDGQGGLLAGFYDPSATDNNAYLLQYDGANWTSFDPNLQVPGLNWPNSVLQTPDGYMWIGSLSGTAYYDGENWNRFACSNSGLPSNNVNFMIVDALNRLWITVADPVRPVSALVKLEAGDWTVYGPETIPNLYEPKQISPAPDGSLWLANKSNIDIYSVMHFDGNSTVTYDHTNSILPDGIVHALAVDPSGNVWVTMGRKQYPFDDDLLVFDGNDWNHLVTTSAYLRDLKIDSSGIPWMATNQGVMYLQDGELLGYNSTNSGMTNDDTTCLEFDSMGNLWIGTTMGLTKYSLDGSWQSWDPASGNYPFRSFLDLEIDSSGKVWGATSSSGLVCFDGDIWTAYTTQNSPLPTQNMVNMALDRQDRMWINTRWMGISCFDISSTPNPENTTIPISTALNVTNYPNPFNPSTTISYSVPTDGEVSLYIYNARGQLVNTLVSEHKNRGNYQVVWQGRDMSGRSVASGLYFTRLVTGGKSISNKMLLMK